MGKPKGSDGGYCPRAAALQPKGDFFQGGVPKLRPVRAKDASDTRAGKPALQVPSSRAAATRPPVSTASGRPQDDTDSSQASLPELPGEREPLYPTPLVPIPLAGQARNTAHLLLPHHLQGAVPGRPLLLCLCTTAKLRPPTPGQRLHPVEKDILLHPL
ncbi:WAS/WASL-interacting protein family member 2 [Lemmus lemmus]